MTITSKLLIAAVAASITLPAVAEQLTPDQALARAGALPSASPMSVRPSTPLSDMRLTYTGRMGENATYYVFNGTKKGFCIVAADDVVSTPMLGFSDEGTFDPNNIPVNMKDWLDEYDRQIDWMIANSNGTADAPATVNMFASATRHDVAPLCATKWDQGEPYNDLCPKVNGQTSFTGCVATSMAQVMKVHNWPKKGQGTLTYTPSTTNQRITVDFSKSEYDWANMTDTYGPQSTTVQKAAVAKLMYDCGVSVKMLYSPAASGALSADIPHALITYFNYDKGIRQLAREYYPLEEWIDILYTELAAGRPVLCGGSNSGGGHAFVIDGYRVDGDYFHLNWGWSGMSDGYFLITALAPDAQGAGGSSAGYNVQQVITIGVQPPVDGSSIAEPNMCANINFSTKQSVYTRSTSSGVQFYKADDGYGVFSYSTETFTINMGVKLVSDAGEESYLEYAQALQVKPNAGFSSFPIMANLFPSSGTYTVTPAFKYNGKWYDVKTAINMTQALKLVATPTTLTFTEIPVNQTVTLNSLDLSSTTLYANRPFKVSFKMTARSTEYFNLVSVLLLKNNQVAAMLDYIQVDLLPGESDTYNLIPIIPKSVTPGSYSVCLARSVGTSAQVIGLPKTITIEAEPAMAYKVAGITFGDGDQTGTFKSRPAEVSLTDFLAKVKINCTTGYFADEIAGVIYNENITMMLASLPPVFVSVNAGETVQVELTGNVSGLLEPGVVYPFAVFGNYVAGQMINNVRYIKGTTSGIEDVTDSMEDVAVFVSGNDLTVTAPSAISLVEVYGMNGALAATREGSDLDHQLEVSLGAAPSGVYVVRVSLADGTVVTRRIVKR